MQPLRSELLKKLHVSYKNVHSSGTSQKAQIEVTKIWNPEKEKFAKDGIGFENEICSIIKQMQRKTTEKKAKMLNYFTQVRAFNAFSYFEWLYLSCSIIGLIISFGLTTERLFNGKLDSSDFTFGILLLLTIVFCCYYVIHAILTERADELLVFVISNIIVVIYCTSNYFSQAYNPIKMARLIIVWIFSPILIGSGLWLSVTYCRSNNLLYNTVGSVAELQKVCKLFYLCSSLLKFDFHLQLSMVVLVMGSTGTALELEQKIILGSGVIFSVIFIAIGFLGLKRESHTLMAMFYALGLLEPAYISYKFYYATTHEKSGNAVYETTFACGVFAFVVWVCLMVATGVFIAKGFNKGLKEKMFEDTSVQRPLSISQATTPSN